MRRSVPTVYMRGGTSRALIFQPRDLPPSSAEDNYAAWSPIFMSAIGSPDPNGRQLNGMGGGTSSLSKVAVVGPSSRPDADVDYTFAQVGVKTATVGYRGNCGNISSAVGPFAVEEGLVSASGEFARVRIHNTNTGKIILSEFALANGLYQEQGDFRLDGVAGSGGPIRLNFIEPEGSVTGRLFPSGDLSQTLVVGETRLEVSLVDVANPVVFVSAAELGLVGNEPPAVIGDNARLMAMLVELRLQAAVAMGLAPSAAEARACMPNLPLVIIVSPLSGGEHSPSGLTLRAISADQPHQAVPLTGAMCTAAAAQIDGTIVSRIQHRSGDLCIFHPGGTLIVGAKLDHSGSQPRVISVSAIRTARRLMEGRVFA